MEWNEGDNANFSRSNWRRHTSGSKTNVSVGAGDSEVGELGEGRYTWNLESVVCNPSYLAKSTEIPVMGPY